MKPAITLAACAFGLALWHHSARAQSQFDGRWDGVYTCGNHALRPADGPFAWKQIGFDVLNGVVSGRYDFRNPANIPTTVTFNGRIDQAGSASVKVISRREDGSENFHQTVVGRVGSPGSIALTGPMLTPPGEPVRDCQLTLSLVAPVQPPITAPTPAPTAQAQPPSDNSEAIEDEWCRAHKDPHTVAICSEPELRTLAVIMLRADKEATVRLNPQQRKALSSDNKYIGSHPPDCDLSTAAPSLPLASSTKQCLMQFAKTWIAYIRSYGNVANRAAEYCLNQEQILAEMSFRSGGQARVAFTLTNCNPQFDDKGAHVVSIPLPKPEPRNPILDTTAYRECADYIQQQIDHYRQGRISDGDDYTNAFMNEDFNRYLDMLLIKYQRECKKDPSQRVNIHIDMNNGSNDWLKLQSIGPKQ